MQKTILITGGFGFLGRAVAKKFKSLGYRVVGIGHSTWTKEEAVIFGYDIWLEARVSVSNLKTLDENFDIVVHCAGNSSVGNSLINPLEDFSLGVLGTAELLEYLRVTKSKALLIFPSSAGVYGAKDDKPIKESDVLNPISPYGYHKKIVEELLEMHSKVYGTRVTLIRFFSIYGSGLKKQLLWDASIKLSTASNKTTFWGTGEETRDWIHIDDASTLIERLSFSPIPYLIVNGATGNRVSVRTILEMLRDALGIDVEINFNGTERVGDPCFYHADVSQLRELGVQPSVLLSDGINRYAEWFKKTWSK